MAGEAPHSILEFRVQALETMVGEVRTAVKSIDVSLQSLARLELHHSETRDGLARAFKSIEDINTRMRVIETEMPTMKLVRNWIMAGVIGGLGMTAVAGFKIVSDNQEYRVAEQAAAAARHE